MTISRRALLGSAVLAAGSSLSMGRIHIAKAENVTKFPSRRVRIIAPFSAGGPADMLCRRLGAAMAAEWNQTVFIENRVGAGGVIGTEVVSSSPPDGYTLGMVVPGVIIQQFISKVSLDVVRDLTPISLVVQNPKCVVVNANVPAKTLAELIDLVRKDPVRFGSYGTSGFGSRAHIAMAVVNDMAKTKFTHVPYRGGSAVIPDLISGQVPVGVLDLGSIFSQMGTGKIRVIAVTGLKRLQRMPDVPTVAELFPGFQALEWYGLVGPAGLLSDIVNKINGTVKNWIRSPDAEAFSKTFGIEQIGSSPEEFKKFVVSEKADFLKVINRLNLKGEGSR